jgi:hypothetical protein
VSYIPDPLGSFLNSLRQTLSAEENPQAHITILPRRPLSLPVETASQQAIEILSRFPAFEVELCNVRRFPETNVMYLDVGKGNARLHAVHDALNAGSLAHNEEFDFDPHLTLSDPVPRADAEKIRATAKAAWDQTALERRFLVDEVVCLWMADAGPKGDWARLWSYRLSSKDRAMTAAVTAAALSRTY